MKFVLLVMLFVCFVLIAVAVYFFYYIRYLIFKDLYYISGYIKNNIVFNKNSISDILSTCKDNVSLYTRLYISKKNIKYFKMMNNNDKKNIDMFFDSLGKGNVDYEIRRNYFNNDLLKESGDELKDFHYAVSFVDQLSDLYDEEGLRDLTPGLAKDLDLAIKTLEKYKHHKDWVQYTLDNALNLKELMPEIKII